MTLTDLEALLANADLSDEADRLMLADAYEEAGRPDDAAALRGQDADDLCDLPHWTQNVAQTTGYGEPDEFGRTMNYERTRTIATDYRDHANGTPWESLHPAERRWWFDLLRDLHRADVALASQRPEVRAYVEGRLDADVDLGQWAAHVRGLIADATAD